MADNRLSLIVDLINNTEAEFQRIHDNYTALSKQTEDIKGSLQSVATYSGLAFGAMTLILGKAVSDYGAFNAEIQRTGAFVNANADQLKTFSEVAIKAVQGTSFTFTQAATALGNFVGGEITAAQASQSLGSIIDLALVAKMSNLQDAVQLGSLALTVFKGDGMQMSNVIDIIASVAANVTTRTEAWSTAIVNSAGAAKAAGFSFKDLNIIFSEMVRGGADVNLIWAAFNASMLAVEAPSKRAVATLQGVGLSIQGLQTALRSGPVEYLDYLKKGFDKANESGQGFAFLARVVGRQAAPEMALALGLTTAQIKETAGWFDNINGSGAKMAQTIRDAAPPLVKLQAAFSQLSIRVGAALQPVLNQLVSTIVPLIQNIADFVAEYPDLSAKVILGVVALTGLVAILSALGVVIMTASASMIAFTASGTAMGTVIAYLTATTVTEFVGSIWDGLVVALNAAKVSLVGLGVEVVAINVLLAASLVGVIVFTAGKLIELGIAFHDFSKEAGGMKNAVALTFLQMRVWALDNLTKMAQGIDDFTAHVPGVNKVMDGVVAHLKAVNSDVTKDFNMIAANAYSSTSSAAAASSSVIDQALEKLKKSLAAATPVVQKETKAQAAAFTQLVDAAAATRKEITTMYADITKANDAYAKSVSDENKSYQQTVVDTVAGAQEKKQQLELELSQANASGSAQQIVNLTEQINTQQSILTTYAGMSMNLDKEVADAKARLEMNDLQRTIADHKTKMDLLQQQYEQDQQVRADKLAGLQKDYIAILAMVNKNKLDVFAAELAKKESAIEGLKAQKMGLQNWMDETKAMYSSYVVSVNSILSQVRASPSSVGFANPNASFMGVSLPGRAGGGPVSQYSSYIVGEHGPELFTPSESGRISPNVGGGGISITITGNTFMGSEGVANKIASDIMTTLKRTIKI